MMKGTMQTDEVNMLPDVYSLPGLGNLNLRSKVLWHPNHLMLRCKSIPCKVKGT